MKEKHPFDGDDEVRDNLSSIPTQDHEEWLPEMFDPEVSISGSDASEVLGA